MIRAALYEIIKIWLTNFFGSEIASFYHLSKKTETIRVTTLSNSAVLWVLKNCVQMIKTGIFRPGKNW